MKLQVVNLSQAVGRLLLEPVFHSSGKKLLAKGHLISEEDIRLLDSEGRQSVSVVILDEAEVPEDEAAIDIATEAACGSMEIRVAAGGRVNLIATENSCVLMDEGLLQQVNESLVVTAATVQNFSFVSQEQRLGTIKSAPFAVPRAPFTRAIDLVKTRGPILQARPIRNPAVAVLYTDPLKGERSRSLFEGIMRTRLERFGTHAAFVLSSVEEEEQIARRLEHLLRASPTVVLIASTTAPAGPEDVVGRAMERVGCKLESFLAPVEPGNLLLLSYVGDTPVIAAPGCFRSPRPNVLDLVLPPLLARYRLSASEIASLGHGGLLN